MTTQYEQFLSMLDNVKHFSPRVHGSKNIKLTQDSRYYIVEMTSSAGSALLGFSKVTGDLMDVIGPLLLPRQDPRGQLGCEELNEIDTCAFQATAGSG
jgi:hypothetical protein